MTTNNSYIKSSSQISLENILHLLKYSGLSISEMTNNSKYKALRYDFNEALSSIIDILVHEKAIHDQITSLALSYPSTYYYDLKEYDTLFETISETIVGLNSIITKASKVTDKNGNTHIIDNRGRVRLDAWQDKEPELFVMNLRWYIRNNILKDLARRHNINMIHTEPDTTATNDDTDSIIKSESIKYNKKGFESTPDFSEDVCRKLSFDTDAKTSLFNAIISRFGPRKPVAAYIYLSVMNQTYDPMAVVHKLKNTNDFNQLFHALLHEIECTYHIDLSHYDSITFNADKYLASFRSIDDESARARIDRLKSTTCKDVHDLPTFKVIKAEHVSIVGKNLFL